MRLNKLLIIRPLCLLLVFTVYSTFSFAADSPIYSHRTKGAIRGVDVVAYFDLEPGAKAVKGKKDFIYKWKGATWKFSSESNRQKFIENPEAYAPQYGGYCAFAVGHGFTTSVRPNSWRIVDSKLYLNYNRTSFKKFWKDTEANIARADDNWPDVLKACESKGRCR